MSHKINAYVSLDIIVLIVQTLVLFIVVLSAGTKRKNGIFFLL